MSPRTKRRLRRNLNEIVSTIVGVALGAASVWTLQSIDPILRGITAKADLELDATAKPGSSTPAIKKLSVTLRNLSGKSVTLDLILDYYPGMIYLADHRSSRMLQHQNFHRVLMTGVPATKQVLLEPGEIHRWHIDPKDLVNGNGTPVDWSSIEIKRLYCEPWVSWQGPSGKIEKPLMIVTEIE